MQRSWDYWQVEVAHKTAIELHSPLITNNSIFRMSFSRKGAHSSFQHAMDNSLSSIKWQFALDYSNDIVTFSKSSDEQIDHVRQILTLLNDVRVKLKQKSARSFLIAWIFLAMSSWQDVWQSAHTHMNRLAAHRRWIRFQSYALFLACARISTGSYWILQGSWPLLTGNCKNDQLHVGMELFDEVFEASSTLKEKLILHLVLVRLQRTYRVNIRRMWSKNWMRTPPESTWWTWEAIFIGHFL